MPRIPFIAPVWSGALALALLSGLSSAQIPAFPGAQGFAGQATGGRGGDVYYVTNLNSSGAGSLQQGIVSAPSTGRTIVFAVSGYIPIVNNSDTGDKTLRIVQPKITIAGQTAPGDGIALKDGRILVTGNNTVLRNLRVRHGKNGGAGDCVNIDPSGHDTILDHVSMEFSTDEIFSMYSSQPVDNLTMQYSIAGWGLETHSKGGLWGVQDISCHHSLWAHNTDRNPKAQPSGLIEWINNVTLDYGAGFLMGATSTPASFKANVVGCYFVHCRYGDSSLALENARIDRNGNPNFSLWLDNCLHDSQIENYPTSQSGVLNGTNKGFSIVEGTAYNPSNTYSEGDYVYAKATAPHAGPTGNVAVTVDPPLTALKIVVSDAGAVRLDAASSGSVHDEIDALLMDDVVNQRRRQINGEYNLPIGNSGFGTLVSTTAPTDSDQDGMPDKWETALGFNPASANNNTVFANNGAIITESTFFPANTPAGYTHLEEYLHFLMLPHAFVAENTVAAPTSMTVDLRRYTSGFSNAPAFTVSGITGGAIQQFASNGTTPSTTGPIVTFTPTPNTHGRAGFSFTVTDAEGSTWTRPFALVVTTGSTPRAAVQLNVDFGSGTAHTGTGAAPVAGTVWNNLAGQSTSSYTITNAVAANGAATPCDITVASSGTTIKAYNQTSLGNPNPTALMSDYLYGNTYTITVTDLPEGSYQLYVYAHGDQAAQASTVTVAAANGGGSATAGSTGDQYRNLSTSGAEGYSFLKFQPTVGASGTLVFTVASYCNGFQLLAQPEQNLFVNMTTANGNTGATHNIPAVSGWGYGAAAPVSGEIWNVFNEVNYNSTFPNPLAVGQVWNIVSNVPLVSADGTTSSAQMSVAYHAVTDALTSDRLMTIAGLNTNQSGGVMEQLMRNYWDRSGVGNFQRFTLSGLTPSKSYLLYVYGAAAGNTSSYRAMVDLDRNGTVDLATTDPSGASDPNTDALFTYTGSGFALTSMGGVWNKALITTDAGGNAVFDSRGHLNGFQLVTYQAPHITGQPGAQTIHVGEQASFSVTATAYPAPGYQWRKDGNPISGATAATFTIPTTTEADAANYTVVVSNAGGSVTSDPALLGWVADPFEAYVSGYGLDPEGNGAAAADPDHDGIRNLLEFFLGMNPTTGGDLTKLPTAQRTTSGPDGVVFIFHRLKTAAAIPFAVEYASDLEGAWTPAAHGDSGVTIGIESFDDDYDLVTVTIPTAGDRIFVRLRL